MLNVSSLLHGMWSNERGSGEGWDIGVLVGHEGRRGGVGHRSIGGGGGARGGGGQLQKFLPGCVG